MSKEHPEVACRVAEKMLVQSAVTSFLQGKLRLAKSQYSKATFLRCCIKHRPSNVASAVMNEQELKGMQNPIQKELFISMQKSSTDEGLLEMLQADAPCECLKNLQHSPQAKVAGSTTPTTAPGMSQCSNPGCTTQRPSGQLKRCGACKAAQYCDRDCQLRHWKQGHKKECTG
eukprot:1466767-Pyramimonas_sp.AAC.1